MATWGSHFPVGVFIDGNNPGDATPTLAQRLVAADLPYALFVNNMPATEPTNHLIETLDDAGVYTVPAPFGRVVVSGDDLGTTWFWPQTPPVRSQAPAKAQPIVDVYAPFPRVLAFNLWDDASSFNGSAPRAVTLSDGFEYADPNRPASGTMTDTKAIGMQTGPLVLTYEYPCGQKADGSLAPEGDFKRATYQGRDFYEMVRAKVGAARPGTTVWMALQAHGARSGFIPTVPTGLREPTAREMRMQFWQAIGEGVKGVFWFIWGTQQFWRGLGDPARADCLSVATELSGRLTSDIKTALLGCERAPDLFKASNAYVSTLRSADGSYYVVVCNTTLSTASIAVTGLAGTLVNLESGQTTAVGGAVSLPALDGSLWRWMS